MPIDLHVLIGQKVSTNMLKGLDEHLIKVFSSISEVTLTSSIELPRSCWNSSRQQFQAGCLLSFAISSVAHKSSCLVLLIIAEDAYIPSLQFVFGVASKAKGGVVSTFRLEDDPDFLKKEIIHELGHAFGLQHCRLPCVMTFSNNVSEAKLKNSMFCERCKEKLSQDHL
ncbi:MAG: Zn-dependent protease [Candidatus Hermodarchaeota archaeon]